MLQTVHPSLHRCLLTVELRMRELLMLLRQEG